MTVLTHSLVSLTIGSILYAYSSSFAWFLCFFISGTLIDLDHYIDYTRECGLSLNLKKIHRTCKYGYMHFKKLTLLLHSYELLIMLWSIIFIFDLGPMWRFGALGFTLHVILDQIANPVFPFAYFLWYRTANNFTTDKIFMDRRLYYADRHR